MAASSKNPDMIYRTLGSTGEKVSAIGLGGWNLGVPLLDEKTSIHITRTALDRGMNFIDNSWDYNNGDSEIRVGKALKDGYRKKAFVMTKIDGRNRKGATSQLEESLKRLDIDCIDLVQHHEVLRFEDPDRIFAEDGSNAVLEEARKAGKIRYIGFTGHKDPRIHLNMLEVAAGHGFRFDTVQMPLNVMDAHFRSFEKQVLPVLVKQKIGVLGMKALGAGMILKPRIVTPIECLHYAMNLPTSVVITGIQSMKLLDQAFEALRTFHPMSKEEVTSLLARTAEAAKDGKYEMFKTSTMYDATARDPSLMGEDSEQVRNMFS
jgi:aryl-alcohol dehydrogenase-like predicted oxidoreductase